MLRALSLKRKYSKQDWGTAYLVLFPLCCNWVEEMNGSTAFFSKFGEYSSEYSYAFDDDDAELPTNEEEVFLEDPFTNLSLNDPKKESSDSGFQLILPNGDPVATMDAQSQGRLLLVSLLENFCDMYDRRPEKNRRLYLSLCRRLFTMGILQSSDFVDESVNVRKAYRSVFKDLVLEAIESIKKVCESPNHMYID